MDIKLQSLVSMSTIANEREYFFQVPFGAPYEEAKGVLNGFIAGLDEMKAKNEQAAADLAKEDNLDSQPDSSSESLDSEPKGE